MDHLGNAWTGTVPCLPGAYILKKKKKKNPQNPKTPLNLKKQRFYDLGSKSHIFPPLVRQLLILLSLAETKGPIPKPTFESQDNEVDRKPLSPPPGYYGATACAGAVARRAE